MIKGKKDIPELLAPAGNMTCALTAFKFGADAVYAGISRFNAREMGDNFSWDDMSRLSARAKKLGKKLYLTLNTLIKENEIEDFALTVEKAAAIDPDALIVQDLGALRLIREYFPGLEIHVSTQMGIHNSAGAAAAAGMGASRVILERQVSMEELRSICSGPAEIEVFVHGALCCSISGHCLFSSWLGGWSGNRGRCKQPCRRRFYSGSEGDKKNGFFFSTMDYYSLDMMDQLIAAGVCSLKIEGRLKNPDYVGSVVSAYRMMLDAEDGKRNERLKEARGILAGSYGRKWSHGFSTREDMDSLINHTSAGVSGRLVATVEKTSANGFEASLIQRIHIGDRIRIQPRSGDEGTAITVTRMSSGGRNIKNAVKGSRAFIHCDKDVARGSMVYKIGSSTETVSVPSDMPLYSSPVRLSVSAAVSGSDLKASMLEINGSPFGQVYEQIYAGVAEPAENRPVSAEDLESAFSITRNENLKVSTVQADPGNGMFIPAGKLKKIRRGFFEWIETLPEVIEALERDDSENSRLDRLKTDLARNAADVDPSSREIETPVFASVYNPGNIDASDLHVPDPSEANVLRVSDIRNYDSRTDEIILPFFCPENELGDLRAKISEALAAGIQRFRITSLYQFELFRNQPETADKKPILTASFPLPAANSLAAMELRDAGASAVQIWLELEREAAEAAARNWPIRAETYRLGKPFLLATRAALPVEGRISDSRGKNFDIDRGPCPDLDFTPREGNGSGSGGAVRGLNCLFPEEVLALPGISGCSSFYDLSRIDSSNYKESVFNYDFTLI